MQKNSLPKGIRLLFLSFLIACPLVLQAQQIPDGQPTPKTPSPFWQKVRFGGGLGLGFGSGYSNIAVAPSGIYEINPYVSLGAGLQYSYLRQKDFYTSHLYGGSLIGLFNPIEQVQLSLELEQLRANVKTDGSLYQGTSDSFWNTGLFFGAGYHMDNVTVGARYNVLFQEDKGVYGDALMPFVRVYF